nr:MAG TPA: hypothetical protein [Crassvirales sp.]
MYNNKGVSKYTNSFIPFFALCASISVILFISLVESYKLKGLYHLYQFIVALRFLLFSI